MLNNHYQDFEKYIKDIRDGNIPACKWTKLAVERHIKDLDNEDYFFDIEAGVDVCNFIEFLKVEKGKFNQTIKLLPFQKFILFNLFGWKRKEDGLRKYRKAYITMAKKNGKTALAAAIGVWMLLCDGEQGAEVYSASNTVKQAKYIWDAARFQISNNPDLLKLVKIYQHSINYKNSFFQTISSERRGLDGFNGSCGFIDEYHLAPTSEVYDALYNSMVYRSQPLHITITTAGTDKFSPCYIEQEYAQQIVEGSLEDPKYFVLIYSLDEGDDIKDQDNWIKANPSFPELVTAEALEEKVRDAQNSPHRTNDILTKHFNVWTSSKSRWLDFEKWKLNNTTFPLSELEGKFCHAGLDLSTSIDLTALALDFPPQGKQEKHRKIYRFFLPEDGIEERERKDKVPYQLWNEQGYLILTPGEVIDYDFIYQEILELGKTYKIKEIAFDPYNAFNIVQKLDNEGFEMVEFRQGYVSMNSAIKNYERLVLSQQLETNDNPVMNWMISNAEVIQDSTGNFKIDKPKRDRTGKRIDGVIADLMATDRSLANTDNRTQRDITKTVRFISID